MSTSATTSKQQGESTGGILDEQRIWIGNLDTRLTEYQLLKILQKCGPIEKFDMLFHKGGPLLGQSRGYAFVTFATTEGALNALEKLNGTSVANRPIVVRLAKNVNYDELDRNKSHIEIPALGTGMREDRLSKEEAIRAIEHKLKMLERNKEDVLELNTVETGGPEVPFIQRYQFNKDREAGTSSGSQRGGRTYSKPSHGPYSRHQRPNQRR